MPCYESMLPVMKAVRLDGEVGAGGGRRRPRAAPRPRARPAQGHGARRRAPRAASRACARSTSSSSSRATSTRTRRAPPGGRHRQARRSASRGRPVQSQYRLIAAQRGLLRVAPTWSTRSTPSARSPVFTLMDGQAVEEGEEVAGCKVTPVAVPEQVVREASYMAAVSSGCSSCCPFFRCAPHRRRPKARSRRRATLFADGGAAKLGWYGADVLGVEEVARTATAVAAAYAAGDEAGRGARAVRRRIGDRSARPGLRRAGNGRAASCSSFGEPMHPGSHALDGAPGRGGRRWGRVLRGLRQEQLARPAPALRVLGLADRPGRARPWRPHREVGGPPFPALLVKARGERRAESLPRGTPSCVPPRS